MCIWATFLAIGALSVSVWQHGDRNGYYKGLLSCRELLHCNRDELVSFSDVDGVYKMVKVRSDDDDERPGRNNLNGRKCVK